MPVRRAAACALSVSLLVVPVALAGDLTPPGAPAPTMKALDVVEPRIPVGPLTTPGDADSIYRITQPGSYYLTGEVLGKAGFYGIQIEANDVSLDLMGFTVRGVPGALSGVLVSGGTRTGIEVANGVIRDWPSTGCSLVADMTVARNLRLVDNGLTGLFVRSGRIEGCTAEGNGANGIEAQQASAILNCVAQQNIGAGIFAGITSSVTNCTAILNQGVGIFGLASASIVGCASQQNVGDGFGIGPGSALVESASRANQGRGVGAGDGALILNNAIERNMLHGVSVTNNCVVRDNLCARNGDGATVGAGIFVTGADNRIEGNNLVANDIGLDVDGAGNFIVRNTASGNPTNYSIVASNKVGEIVAAPNSIAIAGATGGAGVGTTNPWANFSY